MCGWEGGGGEEKPYLKPPALFDMIDVFAGGLQCYSCLNWKNKESKQTVYSEETKGYR